jgi:GntR family transcriptional regulator
VLATETSKTHRLYLLLKEQIVTGALASGDRLPGEPRIAASHSLSRVTVRRALDGLARDGLIRRQPGAGTFVSKAAAAKPVTGDLANMLAHLAAMGRDTEVRLLAFGYGLPPAAVAEALSLPAGERTQHALRVRSCEGEPFSYLSTHVPERIGRDFSEADLASTPMLTLLERSGVVAGRAAQTITATLAAPEVAAALQVEIGAPLLSLTRVVRDADGRGVEHLAALYRPDRHSFHMELTRAGEADSRYWRTADQGKPRGTTRSPRREAAPRRKTS